MDGLGAYTAQAAAYLAPSDAWAAGLQLGNVVGAIPGLRALGNAAVGVWAMLQPPQTTPGACIQNDPPLCHTTQTTQHGS